ncbi:MAG TPA: hypothetical protein VKV74_11240 [Bryobacteraceae bacterium]|nr:hypothetical protein [Bryobacteraceae bacterium]
MEPPRDLRTDALLRLTGGIEAGVVGGAAMLALLMCGSLVDGRGWWEIPNLLGSTFYGQRAFRGGPAMATLSGAALHFTISGGVGAAFGLICGGIRQRKRLLFCGILAALLWHYISQAWFWTRVNPRVPAYAPQPLLMLSHLMFGACLGPTMGRTLPKPEGEAKRFPDQGEGPGEEGIEVSKSPRMDRMETDGIE